MVKPSRSRPILETVHMRVVRRRTQPGRKLEEWPRGRGPTREYNWTYVRREPVERRHPLDPDDTKVRRSPGNYGRALPNRREASWACFPRLDRRLRRYEDSQDRQASICENEWAHSQAE